VAYYKPLHSTDFAHGVKYAIHVLHMLLDTPIVSNSKSYDYQHAATEDWFGHVIAKDGQCGCSASVDYEDGTLDVSGCNDWRDRDFRRAWYCEWFGITLEELVRREQAEQEVSAMNDLESRRREIAYHKEQLERLLQKQGVTIELPKLAF
jgi:hypothetical protein